ncbi:hypothetical protein [Deinococcus sp.]|uniref:hypothetical protein n=1 Tax=Deinococcus sp. TaxID=47478 RepID=UPI0025DCEEFF|nr:hypothetical protein [Deinococcus sp.]
MTDTIHKPVKDTLITLQPGDINPDVKLPRTMQAVVAYAPGDYRLETAKMFGADVVLNPTEVDVAQGLEMIRKLGCFVEFSVFGQDVTVDWSIIGDRKELDVLGAHLGPYACPPRAWSPTPSR